MYSLIGLDLEPPKACPLGNKIWATVSRLWGLTLPLRRPDFRESLGGHTVEGSTQLIGEHLLCDKEIIHIQSSNSVIPTNHNA